MIPNPILKVLSTFSRYKVKNLLIGGQACILYGAAEFSRDTDFVILCDNTNIENLKRALHKLKAERIYVPPLKIEYLSKGHACHFRCQDKSIKGLRIDLLTKMRGCSNFPELWKNRTTININPNQKIEVIGLRDLVSSKKTQRDKDWLMLKRLIHNDILATKNPTKENIKWWLIECKDNDLLVELCRKYPTIAKSTVKIRPILRYALRNNKAKIKSLLEKEEQLEREKDKQYWYPLRKELELLRHNTIPVQ